MLWRRVCDWLVWVVALVRYVCVSCVVVAYGNAFACFFSSPYDTQTVCVNIAECLAETFIQLHENIIKMLLYNTFCLLVDVASSE